MRVLCLHGQGTSAEIFKSQTVALRNKLPPTYTFTFLDGPFHCTPAPGIKVLFESGTYTWWPKPTINAIRGAHDYILDHISQHGPYDILMGFSQGCALIGSLLLYHARETPHEPLPFRAAMFLCGGLPFQVLEDLGLPVSERAYAINEETVRLLKARAGALTQLAANPEQITFGTGLWDDVTGLVHDPEVMPEEEDCFGLDFSIIPRTVRIKIPTVHVFGGKDPRWPASMQLAYFCEKERRTMWDHGGGHDIPRSTGVSLKLAGLLEELRVKLEKGRV